MTESRHSERDLDDLRDQLSKLQGLLSLSMVMTESGDERRILNLATTSVASLGHSHLDGAYLTDEGWRVATGPLAEDSVRTDVESQLTVLTDAGGALGVQQEAWGWAYPLRSLDGHFGYLVIGSDVEPASAEQFLLRALAQLTGIALANARLRARQSSIATELRQTNARLAASLDALERGKAIHDRLTRVAVAGEGQEGIARAVHEVTGYAISIEDGEGNLLQWAGPETPDPYPVLAAAEREKLIHRALSEGRPVGEGDRVVAIARPRADLMAVLVLFDPDGSSGAQERVALEHGAMVLSMELARLHSLAETELRLRRNVVDDLLAGTDEESASARTGALGYNLQTPHRVVVAEGHAQDRDEDGFFRAVRRTVLDRAAGSLLSVRKTGVVILTEVEPQWESFRQAILDRLPGGECTIGVGGP